MKMRAASCMRTACLGLLVSLVAGDLLALELSNAFSNNMVLQRGKPVRIWGTADKGAKVTVSFADQSKAAQADENGEWLVTLDSMAASAIGGDLRCQGAGGRDQVVLRDVVVGDVWFFGRQTYVDISLGRSEAGRKAARAYKSDGNFRALTIRTHPAKQPLARLADSATSGWMTVAASNALGMSGAAFYLGRDLATELGVPVGIVDVDMGPHFGIGWLSKQALTDSVTLHPNDEEIDWLPEYMETRAEERDNGKAQKELDEYQEERVENARGRAVPPKPSLGLHPLKNPMYPSAGYNAVICPLKNLAVKGILLQLGNDYPFIAYRELDKAGTSTVTVELDAAWGDNYAILKHGYRVTPVTLPYVPADWRRTFGDETLPIGLILPPGSDLDVYATHNREIREMQRRTSEKEGLGLIMPGTENAPSSGQPADDRLFADRCRQWVLGAVSGKQDVVPTGPLFDHVEARLSKATVYFKEGTANGLKAIGAALDAFETAGPDRQFAPASARIEGTTVKLKSDGPIQFVRYNWTGKPDQGLVNSAGLPTLPFNTDADWQFAWIPPPEEPNLPEEYSTTADKWGKSDVAIINGQIASMATGDSEPIPRRPGPIGIYCAPFGPNIYVISIDPDTPAVGRLLPGDVIYGVNGKRFSDAAGVPDDQQYRDLADAITYSESDDGEGKLVLSVRRGTKLTDVEIQLEVLGSYSSTTPSYCEKSEKIVANAEAWSARRYRPEFGRASDPTGMLYTDLLFLLASGTPEHQGLVRRAVYGVIGKMTPEPVVAGMQSKPWNSGHVSLLLGEYYHATGDRNVLPYLKYQADLSAESQLKPQAETPPTKEAAQSEEQLGGWRHNYPGDPERWKSGYGLLPHAGMGCVMGMQLAKEAGLGIDELALKRGLEHFNKRRAEYGFVLYSYWGVRRDGPSPVDPDAEANGKLSSMNGKLGMAASLFNMVEDKDTVEICARRCVYGFNNTRHGHGGMFFNNFWTPVGAWAGGEKGFRHFMKGQTWWRELFRRHDGSFNQVGRGGVGVSYALPYVASGKRLRLLGAPRSAFGTNCPDYLKPAIEAHRKRDYALCEELILKQMEGVTPAEDMPVVNHLLDSVRILRASIEHDLALTERLIEEGKHYYASLEMRQLEAVVAEQNPRLKAIVATLASPDGVAKIAEHRKICDAREREKATRSSDTPKEEWITLVAQEQKGSPVPADTWQMSVVEHISHAPNGWMKPEFDDGAWNKATLPISWTMYHTALFRSTFNVDDKDAFDALRVQGEFFQQANVVIYLNGELVAKVDNLERGIGVTDARLTDYATKLIENGENTIAISSRHKRRWGAYRGTYKTAATVGFWVEGRRAEQ